MALSDLAVFSEYVYLALTEVIAQQIDLFNAASRGVIVLRAAAHQGDFSDQALWAKISGLVRRRNAYTNSAVAEKELQHLIDTMVKVAGGTPPVRIDPGMLQWIQRSPEEAGATIGQQLAGDMLADMLNTGILAGHAALSQVTELVKDVTGESSKTASLAYMNLATAKFGDRAQEIVAWIIHSKPMFDIWGLAIANAEMLFNYSTVAIRSDPFGRLYVITDSPSLKSSAETPVYRTLGLVPGAIIVDQNNDFLANEETKNGYENIQKTYQAQWSYNLGVKGFAWDKGTDGVNKSPNDAALAVSANWEQYATSDKDLPGVILLSN